MSSTRLLENVMTQLDTMLEDAAASDDFVQVHPSQLQLVLDRLRWLEREFTTNQDRLNAELLAQQAVIARAHEMLDMAHTHTPEQIKTMFREWLDDKLDEKSRPQRPLEQKVFIQIMAFYELLHRCGEVST